MQLQISLYYTIWANKTWNAPCKKPELRLSSSGSMPA